MKKLCKENHRHIEVRTLTANGHFAPGNGTNLEEQTQARGYFAWKFKT